LYCNTKTRKELDDISNYINLFTMKKINLVLKSINLFLVAGMLLSPFSALITSVLAATVDQSIEICFLTLDNAGSILQYLPESTSLNLSLFTDPGHLVEDQINSYGSESVIIEQSYQMVNRNLLGADGVDDSYCVTHIFDNPINHEYTYTSINISSGLNWLAPRYNDQNSIDFVDPDIAFPYSGEWFDSIVGNESLRNTDADGHLTMNTERQDRRVLVVNQLDVNLPQYAVKFADSVPSNIEYTLTTMPTTLQPGSSIDLRFEVTNMGELLWKPGNNPANVNPVNVSYHWRDANTGEYVVYGGNRAALNHDIAYTFNDSNIALHVDVPSTPGSYELILDLVHEGVTWFSNAGASTYNIPVQISSPEPEIRSFAMPEFAMSMMSLASGSYYTVLPYQGGSWHCGGYDCLSGIAEEYYQCSAKGIPNDADWGDMTTKCWWPIYAANPHLYTSVPAVYASTPWNYLEIGWSVYIPPFGGGPVNPPPPANSSNFGGIAGATAFDPYAGMYGSWSAWPKVTFDRWIAWDGSYKTDAIKWSETQRPQTPVITGIHTNAEGTGATIYGIAIPKNYPMSVAVWNEYRDGWARGSGWEYHYQLATAQHVKVVLFKNNWEYIGQVWNDSPDGRWNISLPLGTTLRSGDHVFAEVQIEADYTFGGLKWWSTPTYETVNFNLRDPKYTGYPYFSSWGSNAVVVPSVYVDTRSIEERWIDQLATAIGSTGGSNFTNVCGHPAKTYSNVYQGNSGAIIFVNGRAIYSYGGTWDTFQYYADRCERFGIPTNNASQGGSGRFDTPGWYQDFEKGRIYWSWKYVGKFVYGNISRQFEKAGGTNSNFGWPTSEVYQATENGTTLNCQSFEDGRICDGEFTPYNAAQSALEPILGHYPATSEISNLCGMHKVSIPGGIAYYDPNYKNVRKVTGAIYAAWGENCGAYGLPENDTSSVTGFGGVTGYAQRFNLGSLQSDFYQKSGGNVVILEGPAKQKYDEENGVGRLGFMQQSTNTPSVAAGRCGSSGLFWSLDNGRIYQHGTSYHLVYGDTPIGSYFFNEGADSEFGLPMNDENTDGRYSWQDFVVTRLQLTWPGGVSPSRDTTYCPGEEPTAAQIALGAALGRTVAKSEISEFCGEMQKVSIEGGIAYYDPNYGNVRKVTGAIYTTWGEDCNTYGLPENDTQRNNSKFSAGYSQRFNRLANNTHYINDYYNRDNSTVVVLEGVARNLFESAGGLGGTGYPLGVTSSVDRRICVDTEGGKLCEKPASTDPTCEAGTTLYNGECVEQKVYDCRQAGLEKYVNPNNPADITCAKINYTPYINQYLDAAGNLGNPSAGMNMCGANAVVMALAQQGIISEADFNTLKTYTYQDNGLQSSAPRVCDWVYDWVGENLFNPSIRSDMHNVKGVWSHVAHITCDQSNWANMAVYLKSVGMQITYNEIFIDSWSETNTERKYLDYVTEVVKNNGGLIHSMYNSTTAHIYLVIGYTDDNLDGVTDRVVVNDSWRDQTVGGAYSLNGRGAIYNYHQGDYSYGSFISY
jgi:hypothetical protein